MSIISPVLKLLPILKLISVKTGLDSIWNARAPDELENREMLKAVEFLVDS